MAVENDTGNGKSREPIVAGMFYERDPKQLDEHLKKLFSETGKTGKNRIVVSPHEGYVYSGKTAAFAISSLKKVKRFIILGPNHSGLGEKFSVMSSGYLKNTKSLYPSSNVRTRALNLEAFSLSTSRSHLA